MSNIKNYYFNNLDILLTNANYWDLFLCYDERLNTNSNCYGVLTGTSLMSQFNFDNPSCISGNTIYSLICWDGSTLPYLGLSLCDIGLTGIDNGFVNNLTGETLTISSGDCRLFLTRVSGSTYIYPWSIQSGSTGQYLNLCGGFFQGFWKLQGFDYQVLPKRMEWGWSAEFWLNKSESDCFLTSTTYSYEFLLSLNENVDGAIPFNSFTKSNDGKLYAFGNINASGGTIFEYNISSNTTTKLFDFDSNNEGKVPIGPPLLINGTLYGVTESGYGNHINGTIFSFELSSSTYTTLHSFSGAVIPNNSLILINNTQLYSTTYRGGDMNMGSIYSFDFESNTYTIHNSFSGTTYDDGKWPQNYYPLIVKDNILYGTTEKGGSNDLGVIYSYDILSNTKNVLHNSSFDFQVTSQILGVDENIYGRTSFGGINNLGEFYKFEIESSTYTSLVSVPIWLNAGMQMFQGSNGIIYSSFEYFSGSSVGVITSLDLNTNIISIIYEFSGAPNDISYIGYSNLLEIEDNVFYGLGSFGGEYGVGGIFKLESMTIVSPIISGETLNDLYPENKGFFFYLGARAENKFWNLFSGETGHTTCLSGFTITPDPYIYDPADSVNSFLKNNGGCNPYSNVCVCGGGSISGCCGSNCCDCICHSASAVTLYNKSSENDIIGNNIGLRIKDDGSIGYRLITYSAQCPSCCNGLTGTTILSGISVVEGYSLSGVVPSNVWTHVVVVFKRNCSSPCYSNELYPPYPDCKKGRLLFYINGYLKYVVNDFDEVVFKDFSDEIKYKVEGVPYNISIGGGSQGLLESQTFSGPDPDDKNLLIEKYFAGTFIGGIQEFRFYDVPLDLMDIRCNYNSEKNRYL